MFQGRSRQRQLALVVGRLDGSECYEHDKALIAAAPELLKALRNLIDVTPGGRAYDEARALLAKLEGV